MEKEKCLATKAIMESGAKVGYLFREASDFDGDSGWRIFTGEESLDFIDKDDNIEIYDLEAIVKKDPDIGSYLDGPVGTELERSGDKAEFVTIESD